MHELNPKNRLDIVNTKDQRKRVQHVCPTFTNAGATCSDEVPMCCMMLDIYVEIAISGLYTHIFVIRL